MALAPTSAANNPPTINPVGPQTPIAPNSPQQTVTLSGISDGDNSTQTLTLSATSSTNATAVATISGGVLTAITPTGPVTSITINPGSGGAGYSSVTPPQVTISPPSSGGTTAEATAIVSSGGVITGFNITNPGSGYTSANPPTVMIALPAGGGTQATASATVTAGGGNYLSPPTVTLSGGGFTTPATATAVLNSSGVVTGFNITFAGMGYAFAPTVAIAPSLISNPTITYLNGSPSALLNYTPVPGNSGVTTITVVAQDNGGTANGGLDSATISFTVTINPNNAPTINPVTPSSLSIPANSPAVDDQPDEHHQRRRRLAAVLVRHRHEQ